MKNYSFSRIGLGLRPKNGDKNDLEEQCTRLRHITPFS